MNYSSLFFLLTCFFTLSLHSGTEGSETEYESSSVSESSEDERETARAKRSGSLIFVPRSIRMKEARDRRTEQLKTEAREEYYSLCHMITLLPPGNYIIADVGQYFAKRSKSYEIKIKKFLYHYGTYITRAQKSSMLELQGMQNLFK